MQAAAFVGNGVNFTIPANYGNYTAQIYNVEYWNATQNQFVTGCIPGNVPMEVEVEVTDPSDSETYFNTFVVDLPSGDLGIGPDLSNGIPSQARLRRYAGRDLFGVVGRGIQSTTGRFRSRQQQRNRGVGPLADRPLDRRPQSERCDDQRVFCQ